MGAPTPGAGIGAAYVVAMGDTPSRISSKVYSGNPSLWRQLLDYNNITDPRALKPGTVLLVPR